MMDHSVTADDDNIRNLRLEQLVTRVFTDLSLMRAAERVLCAQKHAARSQTLMTQASYHTSTCLQTMSSLVSEQ